MIDPQTLVEMQDRFDEMCAEAAEARKLAPCGELCDGNPWDADYAEAERLAEYAHDEDPEN